MPDFREQFRDPPRHDVDRVYMGGTAMSCGMHPTLPKRHRWGPWREIQYRGRTVWERMCKVCALVDDMQFTKPRAATRTRDRHAIGQGENLHTQRIIGDD